jgi:hypothetical protein
MERNTFSAVKTVLKDTDRKEKLKQSKHFYFLALVACTFMEDVNIIPHKRFAQLFPPANFRK